MKEYCEYWANYLSSMPDPIFCICDNMPEEGTCDSCQYYRLREVREWPACCTQD